MTPADYEEAEDILHIEFNQSLCDDSYPGDGIELPDNFPEWAEQEYRQGCENFLKSMG